MECFVTLWQQPIHGDTFSARVRQERQWWNPVVSPSVLTHNFEPLPEHDDIIVGSSLDLCTALRATKVL